MVKEMFEADGGWCAEACKVSCHTKWRKYWYHLQWLPNRFGRKDIYDPEYVDPVLVRLAFETESFKGSLSA